MMMAPALPNPPAVEAVLNRAAMPAAPAVANGRPVGEATAATPAVVAADAVPHPRARRRCRISPDSSVR